MNFNKNSTINKILLKNQNNKLINYLIIIIKNKFIN